MRARSMHDLGAVDSAGESRGFAAWRWACDCPCGCSFHRYGWVLPPGWESHGTGVVRTLLCSSCRWHANAEAVARVRL